MTGTEDRELVRIRLRFVDLFKSFFIDKPDAEKLGRWRGIITALVREDIDPSFNQAVQTMDEVLTSNNLRELQEEHYHLFVDPFNEHQVHSSASFYRDGHAFGPTLIKYRDFLQEAGIKLHDGIHESDDSLVLILDALATLIEREAENRQESRNQQAVLLNRFLLPLGRDFAKALDKNPKARFYVTCAELLWSYLELEKGLLPEPAAETQA